MTVGAVLGAPSDHSVVGTDRIDVMDEHGVRIGWVDPRTGVRNLLAPDRAADFDEMIDFWLAAAGLSDLAGLSPTAVAPEGPLNMQVTEVRFPDPEVIRSLVIPLLPLR